MKITSVEKSKKNKDRLSIYVDGKFSFTISEEDYISLSLYDKSEIKEDTLKYIKNILNFREAKSKGVRYLSLRMRTENEVQNKLLNEGYDPDCTENVINELKAIGYINNKLYAQKYVFDRSKLKPLSKKMMRLELLSRGIPEETADEVLSDWKIEDSVVALGLLKRKFGKYDMSDKKIIRKAYIFLVHRGFSSDTIKEAMKEFGASLTENIEDNL